MIFEINNLSYWFSFKVLHQNKGIVLRLTMWSRIIIRRMLSATQPKQIFLPKYHKTFARSFSQTTIYFAAQQNEDDFDLFLDLGKKNTVVKDKDKNEINSKPDAEEVKVRKPKIKGKSTPLEELVVVDQKLDLSYFKLPHDHSELNKLMLLVKSKKQREKKHQLMIEGRRLIIDALQSGVPLEYILFSNREQLLLIKDEILKCPKLPKIIRVPHNDLSFWSVLSTCPGLIGIFHKPNNMDKIWNSAKTTSAQIIQTEGIKNDENNQFESKPLAQPQITVICDQIREPTNLGSLIRTCAAVPCTQIILTKGCTDPWDTKALRGGCGGQFRVPVRGPMQWNSIKSFLPTDNEYSVFVADNNAENTKTNEAIPSIPYTDVTFDKSKHIVLIIGGETEGISNDALDFMMGIQPKNTLIRIPLSNGVESLNTNVAAAILLFEIRKQLTNI